MTKVIGYYSNWAHNRAEKLPNCGNILAKMVPEDINPHAFTHLHYAFGFITHDFHLGNSIPEDPVLIPRFNALKKKNPKLKTLWSIGGWAFNDPFLGTQTLFSDMVTSAKNRETFIKDILFRIPHLGFDGIDLDWEYPGTERYGRETDKENYVVFLKELREAITRSNLKIIVTITAPASYWYLQQFQIDECQKYLDWINVMTYDIHGSWDKKFGTGVRPHTDMLEVEQAVQLFIKAGVRRENLLLGIAFYGRTFTLSDPSCTKYGCLFSDPGRKGPCTDAEGFLSYPEIEHLRRNTGAKVFHNQTSQTVEVHLGDQWISYETPKTIAAKIAFGKKQCLSGVLIWAVDLDPSGELLLAIGGEASTTLLDAEYCPRSGDWETTKRGSIVKIPCPLGDGEITRTCGKDGKWGDVKANCDDIESEFFKADFTNCKNGPTKDAFAEAKVSPLRRKRELLESIAVDPIHDLWDLMKYTSGDLPNVMGIFANRPAVGNSTTTTTTRSTTTAGATTTTAGQNSTTTSTTSTSTTAIPTAVVGTCGNGVVGNAICPVAGECCSQYGWCGTSVDHCANTATPSPQPETSPAVTTTSRTTTTSKPTTTTAALSCAASDDYPSVAIGQAATKFCPLSQVSGNSVRVCNAGGVWGAESFDMCVPPCSEYHTVGSGEGCWSIANANGIPDYHVFDTLNLGVSCDTAALTAGRSICIRPCITVHTVQPMQDCWTIAGLYGIQWQTLETMNPGVSCDQILAGQALCVRKCTQYYTIQSGDGSWKVAQDQNLTEAQLAALNPGLQWGSVQIGQAVCVGANF